MSNATEGGARILVVDDSEANRSVLRRLLEHEGHVVATASNGDQALAAVRTDRPDLVLLDVVMPGISGLQVCRQLKTSAETRLIPVVLITTLDAREDRLGGIRAGADEFLRKPVDPQELIARTRSLLALKRYTDHLESAELMLEALAMTIEARDPYTRGHCERLARYARAFGERLSLGEDDLASLERGGVLHDLGKIAVPDYILGKTGPLTEAEYVLIRRHTVVGDELCARLPSLRAVRPIVRHHHELWDGTGYPDGLAGDAIPLLAQIMGIVDVFDALTTDRPYRMAASRAEACEALRIETARGRRRPDLVEAFVALALDAPTSSEGRAA